MYVEDVVWEPVRGAGGRPIVFKRPAAERYKPHWDWQQYDYHRLWAVYRWVPREHLPDRKPWVYIGQTKYIPDRIMTEITESAGGTYWVIRKGTVDHDDRGILVELHWAVRGRLGYRTWTREDDLDDPDLRLEIEAGLSLDYRTQGWDVANHWEIARPAQRWYRPAAPADPPA